jgi:hypothetical protein
MPELTLSLSHGSMNSATCVWKGWKNNPNLIKLGRKLHYNEFIHEKNTTLYNSIRLRRFIFTFIFAEDDFPYILLYSCTPSNLALCSDLLVASRSRTAHEKREITAFWCMKPSFKIIFRDGIFPGITLLYTLFSFTYMIHPLLAIYCLIRVFLAQLDTFTFGILYT